MSDPEDTRTFLSPPDEYGDSRWVDAWDDGGGVEIEAPGCGTASLTNEEAKVLLRWLIDRYGAEKGWLPR